MPVIPKALAANEAEILAINKAPSFRGMGIFYKNRTANYFTLKEGVMAAKSFIRLVRGSLKLSELKEMNTRLSRIEGKLNDLRTGR